MKLFYHLYLKFTDFFMRTSILTFLGVRHERVQAWRASAWQEVCLHESRVPAVLFHAASVGELEILIPLIEGHISKNLPFAVTVFSPSAFQLVKKFSHQALYVGPSPLESEWEEFFKKFLIQKIILSKYEAWPGLWISSAKLNLPLILIQAQFRRSLKWVKRILCFFGFPLPRLFFFTVSEIEMQSLQKVFPNSRVMLSFDPRSKRIVDRMKLAPLHPRVQHWSKQWLPRPYGIVGSAWLADLKILIPAFKSRAGTLWVVPHSLDEENLARLKRELEEQIPGRYMLINEMGYLLELYSLADWVWVGGGFGKGIHSALEPSFYGVPLACGPNKVKNFLETESLIQTKQLTLCQNSHEASHWLEKNENGPRFSVNAETLSSQCSQLIEQCVQIS